MAEPEIIEGIKTQLQTPNLSNRDLMTVFQKVFPVVSPSKTTTSGCWVITGHGNDLDVKIRTSIIDEMLNTFEEFADEKATLSSYITNNVSLTMAMGLPGPSAPMQVPLEDNERWAGLTTSEVDVQIVRNIYQLFDQYIGDAPVSPDMLDVLDYIVKQQLRANFIEIWGRGGEFQLSERGTWQADIVRLMRMEEIWVTKKVKPDSADRYYQLRPNEGENPEFRAREGLHLIDMRDVGGIEIPNLVLPVSESRWGPKRNPLPTSMEFDLNNIQFPEAKRRLEAYFYGVLDIQRATKEDNAFKLITNKIFSKTEPDIFLSELIMLGYLLKIQRLQIYDPLCRPLEDSSATSETRSGEAFRGQIPGIEALHHDTLPREGSEKVLGRITKKCDKKGQCAIMGGKTRKTRKTKKTRKFKRSTKKSKRTRNHRRK
uniref:Uncharacterized protein n=1 Tax=viral metagenome TaxID=1070528 RepID=A0A6C0JYA8_9ZZZZ